MIVSNPFKIFSKSELENTYSSAWSLTNICYIFCTRLVPNVWIPDSLAKAIYSTKLEYCVPVISFLERARY